MTFLITKDNWGYFAGFVILLIMLGLVTAVSQMAALILVAMLFSLPVLAVALYRPYWVLIFLTAFMPFENLFLKFLPVSGQIYLLAQLLSEALIYLTFLIVILKKLMLGQSFSRTPIDIPLLFFIIVAVLSIIINQSPIVGSLLQLRTLLRYTILFYLIVNINISTNQVNTLLKIVIFVGIIQLVIGGLQLTVGGPINQFLVPRQVEAEIAGQTRSFILVSRGREIGSIYGTLGDTVYYGYFMLFFLAVYLARMQSIKWYDLATLGAIFLAINYSFSRAAVFGFLFLIIIYFRFKFGRTRSILTTIVLLPIAVLGILFILATVSNDTFINPVQQQQGIVDNIRGIFTQRYIEVAQKQRLGHLLGTAPTILANRPILGYGPDEDTTISRINESKPSYLLTPLTGRTANTFEDVFWVALLSYYGIVGVSILAYLLHRLYHLAYLIHKKSPDRIVQQISATVFFTISLAPILLFFNQTLEFRIYGFYFWLFPALMFALTKNNPAPHGIKESISP